ncbi:MAG: Ig-like domain-containing protein [Candidatus Abawacabacteria bacterium]|nr:Ig-like domain-containing protein [Candidatus Abawacabacteria bacterium]
MAEAKKKLSVWYKFLIGAVTLFILVGVAMVGYSFLTPPQVRGDNLVLGQIQKIDHSSPVRIPFSRWMDKASVEAAFHITPYIEGSFQWEGSTLVFIPQTGNWGEKKQYQVWIDTSAQDILRKKLAETFYQGFEISGPPTVIMNLPQGEIQDVAAPLIIVFDRPMISASTLTQMPVVPPVNISPSTPGKYQWVGTNTLQFTPEQWQPATSYTVTVAKSFQDLYGLSLQEDYSWHFDTAHPTILYSYPANGYEKAGPQTEVIIRFNQAIDQHSLEQNIDWEITEKRQKVSFALRLEEEGTKVVLTPQQPLPYQTSFLTTVHKGLKSAHGTFALEQDFVLSFSTVGLPLVEKTEPQEGSKDAARYGVTMQFTNPMSDKDIDRFIKVEPRIENQFNDLSEYAENQTLTISGDFLPSTHYVVTLNQNWVDQYGQKMPFDFILKFDTAPIPADVAFVGRQEFGLIDGYGDRYEQILQAINVEKVRLSLGKINVADIWPMLKRESTNRIELNNQSTWDISSPNPLNQVVEIPVDITSKIPTSGVYLMRAQAVGHDNLNLRQVFLVSKTALTLKVYPTGGMVWATDLKSGLPVAGMQITLFKDAQNTLLQGTTDADGLFSFPWPSSLSLEENGYYNFPSLLAIGQKGDDFALTGNDYSWGQGIEAWNFYIAQSSSAEKVRGFVTTDRPLYLPGQQVFFKGIYRTERDNTYQLLSNATKVKAKLINPTGDEIWSKELLIDSHSTVSDTVNLPVSASLGNYTLETEIANERQYITFQVQEYKKPLFKVEVQTPKEEYVRDEVINVKAKATYYFGMPLSTAKVSYRVYASDYFFYPDGYDRYQFSDIEAACLYCDPTGRSGKPWVEKTTTTNEQGEIEFTIPTTFTDEKESQMLNIEVGVEDPNTKEMIYSSQNVIVHKGDFYLGIANQQYVVEQKENATFAIASVNVKGTARTHTSGEATLYKREYKTVKKKGVDGFFYYDTSFIDTAIKNTAFTTGSDGKTNLVFSIPEGGQYHVGVRASDNKGHTVVSGTNVWVNSETYINWGRDNNDRMDIIPDKKEYTIGETAKLLVKSPYEGVKGLLTIERNGIIEKRIIDISTTATVIELPLKPEYLPNVFVSLLAVKGYGKDNIPGFKLGYVNLRINTSIKALHLDLSSDASVYTPQSVATVNLTVKDANGKPVRGDFAVAVVDQSLLALSGQRDDNLIERFFGQRSLSVYTFNSLVTLIKRIDVKKGGGSKGGDGAAALAKRKQFKDTAYFNPHIQVNEEGKAQIKFTLPDNITTWQVWVFGATDDTSVGSATLPLLSKKDVFVEPILPKFATSNDRIKIGATVHNTSVKNTNVKVSLDTENIDILSNPIQDVQLPAQSSRVIYWESKVTAKPSLAKLTFHLQGENNNDNVEKTIPVYAQAIQLATAFGGTVREQAVVEQIIIPVGTVVESIKGTVKVSSQLQDTAMRFSTDIQELPYSSSDVIAAQLLVTILDDKFTPIEKEKRSAELVQRLYVYQQNDGGFNYFPGLSNSNPYVSAYVFSVLTHARSQNITIDSQILQRAKDYLVDYLNQPTELDQNAQKSFTNEARKVAETQMRETLDNKAYVAFVLAKAGESTLPTQTLVDRLTEMSLASQAHLAMALLHLHRDDQAQSIVLAIKNKVVKTATLAHFQDNRVPLVTINPVNNGLYTNTVILQLLATANANDPLIADLMRYVLSARNNDICPDIFTKSLYTLVAHELNQQNSAAVTWKVLLNDKEIGQGNGAGEVSFSAQQLKLAGEENTLLIQKTGNANLYYTGLLEYEERNVAAMPLTQGINVYREYFALEDKEGKTPLHSFHQGQDVYVRLSVIVPHDQYLVTVDDPLPAGLNAQNFVFQTSSRWQQHLLDEITALQLDRNTLQNMILPWTWTHQEMKDDRVITYARFLSKGVYQINYIAKAGVSGTYQVRPARAFVQHAPDIFGTSAAKEVIVTP